MDEQEIESRRAFFEIADDDLRRLARLRGHAERHAVEIIDSLYELIISHPQTRKFFPDEASLARVKRLQRAYFLGLFEGRCDRAYVDNRLRVGEAHERIGLAPKWYIGAYGRYLRLFLEQLFVDVPLDEAREAYKSLTKLVAFDMALAIDTYIAAHLQSIERHRAAIRELSTPVIRVHERVLLLPLIGTVDTHRAQQIMEMLLTRVVAEQAKVVIVDIAGVAVVDTQVAKYLLEATQAVKLLGAETIVSGITPQVARTVVQLGLDISAVQTRSRLDDAIELGLRSIGKAITGSR